MADIEAAYARAREAIDAARDDLVRISRDIHGHPELAFEERHAAEVLTAFLERQGFAVERGVAGLDTAFRATWGEGPVTVAYLLEYDALPEIGHACGHNLIATASLAGALGLKAAVGPADARVVALGTPAEEGGGGKILMINAGVFRDVDVALMAHPAPVDIAAPPMYGVATVVVRYRGKASHASFAPELGINALDAMVTAYQAIAQLRQHMRRDSRIHGIITDGGTKPNIVPEHAAGEFYVRALDPAYLEELKRRVEKCFEAGALAAGATVEWEYRGFDYAPMRNNRPLVEAYRRHAEALGRRFFDGVGAESTGSTDQGNVSQVVPAIHPMFGVGQFAVNHSPEFTQASITDAAHEAMLQVGKALAFTGVDVALDPDLLRRAKEAFASGK
ncbi:MAG TPA: M20 family metallopeptidase [Dehalococcoidia bacterium]|nr:M20 family metallopeptidase [Dehalococcoidia bacterium]